MNVVGLQKVHVAVCALVNIRGEIDPYPWVHPDRAHIQFITPSSMVDAGPRWADQMNSSNEAAKATPQTTTTFSASTLTWTPGETVLAIAAICDLPFQPKNRNWSGIGIRSSARRL